VCRIVPYFLTGSGPKSVRRKNAAHAPFTPGALVVSSSSSEDEDGSSSEGDSDTHPPPLLPVMMTTMRL